MKTGRFSQLALLIAVALAPSRRAEAAKLVVSAVMPERAAVVERCLAFDPDGRFADATAVLDALRTAARARGAA